MHEIIEWPVVRLDAASGQEVDIFHSYVRPEEGAEAVPQSPAAAHGVCNTARECSPASVFVRLEESAVHFDKFAAAA